MVVERHGVDVAVDSGGERRRQGSAVARRAGLRGKLNQDNSILLYQVVPSASKIEAEILREFELNLDHPGGK